ncbi:MAG: hypothetical protein A2W05_02315 [Candidatus Schekmanbacteria bacterium RBG_16_38_10]|uniref:Molybdopterin molybdenumtransferase n=1 Tax=Candidatus Schekmanbacteria bacterium RBG_16_38_10 TaxID=1817879 RepID=A0A1F7RSC1_9BACT|nr:MAG: hypothetical protein A2W05_02315 [Candidatus Schekmanbacteria bacterium RBG_16_38_10]
MISLEEARDIILSSINILGEEEVSLLDSLGRVITENVHSHLTVPPWNNSAMDGYAVIASDIKSASKQNPVKLKVLEDLPAGKVSDKKITNGETIRIMTGAPIPSGADAVVMHEVTEKDGDFVRVYSPVLVNENIRPAGEDINVGDLLIKKGRLITPADIGIMATIQKSKVTVFQKPRVAILSTGDEIVDIDEPITRGKIVNSNSYSLEAQVKDIGAIPLHLGIAKDTKEALEKKLLSGLSSDVLVTSGGISVGDFDFVKDVLKDLGMEMKFWKVAMKPGKPLAFGEIKGKPVFGLPGNPASSMLCFELFVRPALLKMSGRSDIFRKEVIAESMEDIKNKPGRRYFIRTVTSFKDGQYFFKTTGSQGSGILTSMTLANSLAIISENCSVLKKGEKTKVILLDERI